MRYALLAACAAVLIAPGGAMAQTGKQIEIEGNRATVQSWSADVSRALDRKLTYPMYYGFQGAQEGYASVGFHVGKDGTPVGISLIRSSGSWRLDHAALRAVAGITKMPPLPNGVSATGRVRANVLFGLDQSTRERLARKARDQFASDVRQSGQTDEIALTVMPGTSAG